MSGAAGVTCAKCLGRITPENLATSRKIQEKLRPGEPFRPPRVCSECVLLAIVTMADGSDPEPESGGWGIWIIQAPSQSGVLPPSYCPSYWWQGPSFQGDHVMTRAHAEEYARQMRLGCPAWTYEVRPYSKPYSKEG